MATYDDLRGIIGSAAGDSLRHKVSVGVAIKAHALLGGAPTAGQLLWAQEALAAPGSKAVQVLNYMIAANESAALSAITGASDTVIQTNVDAAVDKLVT